MYKQRLNKTYYTANENEQASNKEELEKQNKN